MTRDAFLLSSLPGRWAGRKGKHRFPADKSLPHFQQFHRILFLWIIAHISKSCFPSLWLLVFKNVMQLNRVMIDKWKILLEIRNGLISLTYWINKWACLKLPSYGGKKSLNWIRCIAKEFHPPWLCLRIPLLQSEMTLPRYFFFRKLPVSPKILMAVVPVALKKEK